MDVAFKTGEFQTFRVTTKIHLGSIEMDLEAGAEVLFDGATLKVGDKDYALPALKGAVKTGWIVPSDAPETVYRPKPSEVVVKPAQSTKSDRGTATTPITVHDEERNLGNLQKVRDHGDGIVRKVSRTEDASDGEVVGKLRSAAKKQTTLTNENEMSLRQEINRIDNTQGVPDARVIPVRTASEDVGASSGDALDELLGDSAVVARPPPVSQGPLGEGDSPHLTSDEKGLRKQAASLAAEQARQARLNQVGAQPAGKAAPAKGALPAPAASLTMADVYQVSPGIEAVLSDQGVGDIDTLRGVLSDPVASAELARALKAGPMMKLRRALNL